MSDRELSQEVRRLGSDVDSLRREVYRAIPVRHEGRAVPEGCVLMVALMDFTANPVSPLTDLCSSTTAGLHVARCARVKLREHIVYGGGGHPAVPATRYLRPDGEAVCVWQAMSAENQVASCQQSKFYCGDLLWVKQNNGRWEVVSGVTMHMGSNAICQCTYYGFALWKVIDDGEGNPIWEVDENRCTGCYSNGHPEDPVIDRPDLDGGLEDIRFTESDINDDWLVEPGIPAPESWMDGDERYVTCCFDDPTPAAGCELECCYAFAVNIPGCDGEPDGEAVIIMEGGGSGETCIFTSGDYQDLVQNMECTEAPPSVLIGGAGVRAQMYTAIGLRVYVRHYSDTAGVNILVGRYSLSAAIDCVATLTATLQEVTSIYGGGLTCTECPSLDYADTFPASMDVIPFVCADDPPLVTGRCCDAEDNCSVTTEGGCVGTWIEGEDCTDGCTPLGRCCYGGDPDYGPHGCEVTTADGCTTLAGGGYMVWSEGLDCGALNDCNEDCVPGGCQWTYTGEWAVTRNACYAFGSCAGCETPPGFVGEMDEVAYTDCEAIV